MGRCLAMGTRGPHARQNFPVSILVTDYYQGSYANLRSGLGFASHKVDPTKVTQNDATQARSRSSAPGPHGGRRLRGRPTTGNPKRPATDPQRAGPLRPTTRAARPASPGPAEKRTQEKRTQEKRPDAQRAPEEHQEHPDPNPVLHPAHTDPQDADPTHSNAALHTHATHTDPHHPHAPHTDPHHTDPPVTLHTLVQDAEPERSAADDSHADPIHAIPPPDLEYTASRRIGADFGSDPHPRADPPHPEFDEFEPVHPAQHAGPRPLQHETSLAKPR
jgi:hypothetical protein